MTKYVLDSGELLQTLEISNVRGPPPQAVYTFEILNGWRKGMQFRLTEREMALNGARQVK